MYTSPVEIHSCCSTKEVSVHHTSHAKASRYTNKQSINSRNVIKIYNIRSCHTSLDCIISSKSSVPSSTMTASTPKLKPVKRISVLLLSLQNKTKKLLQEFLPVQKLSCRESKYGLKLDSWLCFSLIVHKSIIVSDVMPSIFSNIGC